MSHWVLLHHFRGLVVEVSRLCPGHPIALGCLRPHPPQCLEYGNAISGAVRNGATCLEDVWYVVCLSTSMYE